MRRWNDKLRPAELYEIDKQAHKMIVAWTLSLLNSGADYAEDSVRLQEEIIEKALFDYFYRLITTDIKPPVFYKICENKRDYAELTEWVLKELKPVIGAFDPSFQERMEQYHRNRDRNELSDRILAAAHLYASGWEYHLIRPLNLYDEESSAIADAFIQKLDAITGVDGLNTLLAGKDFFTAPTSALGRFARFSGQLRFQIRWSDTPRVPPTSVLGHMFLVAALAYCFSLAAGACPARRVNNFFAGLFHDLPELLTRDIITPVKRSVEKLPGLIRSYELHELEHRIFNPLTEGGFHTHVDRLRYYLGLLGEADSEFNETVRTGQEVRKLASFQELHETSNYNHLDPKDGELLKICDSLAAYLEAYSSIQRGMTAPTLRDALSRFRLQLREKELGSISLAALMADFE